MKGKPLEYYASLAYTVELEVAGEEYHGRVKELPGCEASVGAHQSVEELCRLLEGAKREWIERTLGRGEEVPEPMGVTEDPFWESFEEKVGGFDGEALRKLLYGSGILTFPFRILEELWTDELRRTRLGEVRSSSVAPPKAGTGHQAQVPSGSEEDMRPVHLGKSYKVAWIRLGGRRTERGYRDVEVLDQPLRTEAAVVAALTVLETSTIRDADFERLRKALLERAKNDPKLKERNLHEVLDDLPVQWFSEQKAAVDEEMERLSPKERKKRLGNRWERWQRTPPLWWRSMNFMVALLRYRRADFDAHTLDKQLDLLNQHRKRVNKYLEEQRKLMAFLEYGTPRGLRKAVERAQDQVKAAVLADVEDLKHLEIAHKLGEDVDEDRYSGDMKVPVIADLVRDGRNLLNKVAGAGGWQKLAEEMKNEAQRYGSLNQEEKEIEQLAGSTGWSLDRARSFLQSNPGGARLLIFAATSRRT